jgi:hypothetical protein
MSCESRLLRIERFRVAARTVFSVPRVVVAQRTTPESPTHGCAQVRCCIGQCRHRNTPVAGHGVPLYATSGRILAHSLSRGADQRVPELAAVAGWSSRCTPVPRAGPGLRTVRLRWWSSPSAAALEHKCGTSSHCDQAWSSSRSTSLVALEVSTSTVCRSVLTPPGPGGHPSVGGS